MELYSSLEEETGVGTGTIQGKVSFSQNFQFKCLDRDCEGRGGGAYLHYIKIKAFQLLFLFSFVLESAVFRKDEVSSLNKLEGFFVQRHSSV